MARTGSLRPTARQVNLLLEGLLVLSFVTGVMSWAVDLGWARPFTLLHAVSGLAVLVLAPLKITGSVRSGMKRGRRSRWLSAGFGLVVLATVGFGLLHATGLWHGVGYWSALWTHLLLSAVVLPLLAWHVLSRPLRPATTDLNRRALLSAGATTVAAGGLVGGQELVVRLVGLDGADRAGTGSHELASFDPGSMPVVSWLDDRIPEGDPDRWSLTIAGTEVEVAQLAAASEPLEAVLDCTGGWRSVQRWDAVPLAEVLADGPGRAIRITSATGYARLFPRSAAGSIYLATGYGGRPLRPGHGAPVRLVAPGRRGPWWVKWVTTVERTDRPAWLQFPFPLS